MLHKSDIKSLEELEAMSTQRLLSLFRSMDRYNMCCCWGDECACDQTDDYREKVRLILEDRPHVERPRKLKNVNHFRRWKRQFGPSWLQVSRMSEEQKAAWERKKTEMKKYLKTEHNVNANEFHVNYKTKDRKRNKH